MKYEYMKFIQLKKMFPANFFIIASNNSHAVQMRALKYNEYNRKAKI